MRRSRVGLPGHTGLPSPGTHLSGKPTNQELGVRICQFAAYDNDGIRQETSIGRAW